MQSRSSIFLLTLLALAAPACVANEESFFIVQNQVPIASGVGGMCMIPADPMQLHIDNGVMDLSLTDVYILNPLYRNEMRSTVNRTTGAAETRGLFMDYLTVELHADTTTGPLLSVTGSNGQMISMPYTVDTTTFVDAATTSGPGLAVGTVVLIPPAVGDALRARFCNPGPVTADCPVPQWPNTSVQYVAVIKPFGHTMGQIYLEGATYNYPITFCCHCLVQFPSGSNDPNLSFPNCSGTGVATTTTICSIGQDTVVPCTACSGNVAECQPPGFQFGTTTCPTF